MRLFQLLLLCLLSTTFVTAQEGEISGRSWLDENLNGLIDSEEAGLACEVLLTRSADGFIVSANTDAEGNFTFTGLVNGAYSLEFIPAGRVSPTYYRNSLGNVGGNSDLNFYAAPYVVSVFLNQFALSKVVNAGWVEEEADLCTTGTLSVERKPRCSINDPEVAFRFTAKVNPPQEGLTYEWSDGQTTPTAVFTEEGSYSVTATDPGGCIYVNRSGFRTGSFPTPVIMLNDEIFACGENLLRYSLPDSILNSGFDFQATAANLLPGVTLAELMAGEVELTEPGRLYLSLFAPQSDCEIRVTLEVGQPGPTDEFYLEATSFNPGFCNSIYDIGLRGGAFDNSFFDVPAGYTARFFGPGGQEPNGFIQSSSTITRQPTGIYTVFVTSACGSDRVLTITTPGALECQSMSGSLLLDQSGGCSADGAIPIPGTRIAFTSTTEEEEFYAFTRYDGSWSVDIPKGSYTVLPLPNPQYAATYCDVGEVTVGDDPLTGVDLVMARQAVCPVLTTSVLMPRLRRGFQSRSFVTYRNEGTGPAENAQLEVELDPFMESLFSDRPFTRDGNKYTFDLGRIPAYSSGRIELLYFLNGAVPGQNHCIKSKITPSELCISPAGWQGAIIRTDYASCNGDQLTFTVANAGAAATSVDVNYYVLRNGELEVPLTSLGLLPAGASQTIELPANGDTYQIFTNQEPNAPAALVPSDLSEGCGRNAEGSFSVGFANLFPVGNGLSGEGIYCRANTGSYDPNEKLGYPLGLGADKDIEPGTRITYDVHFQNTGTDTAYIVIIKDTLPEGLDLRTLQLGGSSHDYVASIDTNRVLTFRFDDIILPDSAANLIASQGVVQFSIDHDDSLLRGDRFQNNAAIFFDFNEPVITEYSRHRLAPEILINPTAANASIADVTNASCGRPNGSITIAVVAGIPPFSYAWSHDNNLTDSIATGLEAGMYAVTVTASNGAKVTLEQEVTVLPVITETAAAIVQPTTCGQNNGSIVFSFSGGVGERTYAWQHDSELNSPEATDLAPGDYRVTVTDEAGCSYSSSALVTAIPRPLLLLEATENAACDDAPGSATFLLLNYGQETDLGIGLHGTTITREVLGPDSIRIFITGLPAGDYAPMVVDGNGCRAEVALQIFQDTPVIVELVGQSDITCNGGMDGNVMIDVRGNNPPFRYQWNGATMDQGPRQENLPAGPYEVVVTDARGCFVTYTGVINEPDALSISAVINPSTCAGSSSGTIRLSVEGGVTPYTYRWSDLPMETDNEATGLASGDYRIEVIDANGCVLTTTETVTEEGNNIVISVADSTSVSCRGVADGSLTVLASGSPAGFTYSWDNGQSGATATGLAGGQSYVVLVSNTDGCSSRLRIDLAEGPLARLSGFPKDTFVCEGNAYPLDLSSYNDRQVDGPNGFSSSDELIGLTEAGNYTISVIDATGCSAATSLSLTVTDSSFAAGVSVSTDAVITLPLPAVEQSIPQPDSVSWLYDESVTLSGQQGRTYLFTFTEPGNYTLGLVAYLRGCVDSTLAEITMHADSSTITGVAFIPASSINLRVSPNPSGGTFTVSADLPFVTKTTAYLYDVSGQLVLRRELPLSSTVNEHFDLALPAGVYYLQLLSSEAGWVVSVVVR